MKNMTRIFLIVVLYILVAVLKMHAQVPVQFNYQAIARNAAGTPLVNQSITIRLKIHTTSPNGVVQYSETRLATTNASGLFTVAIGSAGATNVTGNLSSVSWTNGEKFLQVEIDPAGGNNFIDMGTTQLLSVPYALNSGDNQWQLNADNISNKNPGNVGIGTPTPDASAIMHVQSNQKGVLFPRMSSTERKAIVNPAIGLIVFDLTKSGLYMYDGMQWLPFSISSPNAIALLPRTATDGMQGDIFGRSVAIDGDYAIVGSYYSDINGNSDQGAAYIYFRNGGSWVQQAKLVAPDGVTNDHFGQSVAIYGDYAVVGAPVADKLPTYNTGAVYVFVRNGTNWTLQAKLTASDAQVDDYLGVSVSIDGNYIVAGASGTLIGSNNNQGSAYIFNRNGSTWTQQAKIFANDGASDDQFGNSCSISGDYIAIGSLYDNIGTNPDQGSAYIFFRNSNTWNQQAKLVAADGAAQDFFGISISINGNTVVVGSYGDDLLQETDAGSAYIYSRSGTTWAISQKIYASNLEQRTNDLFGFSVSVYGDSIIIGSLHDQYGTNVDQGSSTLFTKNSYGTWLLRKKFVDVSGSANQEFGNAVGLSGDNVVIGARGDNASTGKVFFLNLEE